MKQPKYTALQDFVSGTEERTTHYQGSHTKWPESSVQQCAVGQNPAMPPGYTRVLNIEAGGKRHNHHKHERERERERDIERERERERYMQAILIHIHRLGRICPRPGLVDMDIFPGPRGPNKCQYPPARAGDKSGKPGRYG
jgi:hypothetical protein